MSRLITGNTYYGFQVVDEEFIPENESNVFTLEHLKSGARLLFVQNQDDNKVFSVSFRTPPEDSTGSFIFWSIPYYVVQRNIRSRNLL